MKLYATGRPAHLAMVQLWVVVLLGVWASHAFALLPESQWADSADYRDSEILFRYSGFARIDVLMDSNTLQTMLSRTDSNAANADEYFPCTVVYHSDSISSETVENAGFRLKGNTSRGSDFPSFKLKFNEFVPGRSVHGLKRLNLVGESNDTASNYGRTLQRSRLGWELMRRMDLAAPRTAYSRLTINGKTTAKRGDQTVQLAERVVIEDIDDVFLGSRFEQDDGNLFKCLYPAPLVVRSAGDYDYIESWGRAPYELQSNELAHDYSGLAHFIEVLNQTPSNQLEQTLPSILNVDAFLRSLAVEVAIGQWDNYWSNMNNYWLYENEVSGQVEFMSYDLDNTFGIDFFGVDWARESIYNFHVIDNSSYHDKRPLVKRLLDNSSIKERYSRIMKYMMDNHFNNATLDPIINAWASETHGGAGDGEQAIKDFISTRRASILSQLSGSLPTGTATPYPTLSPTPSPTPNPLASDLRINEFMASNSSIFSDSAGEYDDWIELINGGTATLDAGGYYITDTLGEPTRYQLPAGLMIPPGGFIIIWADNDAEQDNPAAGQFHTTYKLDAGGEEIAIFKPDGATLVDHCVFGAQTTDVSMGRYPDATGAFVVMQPATPRQSNRIAMPSLTPTPSPTVSASPTASPSFSASPSPSPSPSPTNSLNASSMWMVY